MYINDIDLKFQVRNNDHQPRGDHQLVLSHTNEFVFTAQQSHDFRCRSDSESKKKSLPTII